MQQLGKKTIDIVMIGAFPPPVHGMALINQAFYDKMREENKKIKIIDISHKNIKLKFANKFFRIKNIFLGLKNFFKCKNLKRKILYISASGGFGQIYDIIFLFIGRLKRMRIVVHHHSFAYIDKFSFITYILKNVAGKSAIHITLCKLMKNKIKKMYNIKNAENISNSIFVYNSFPKRKILKNLHTIGFLSNITKEKGIFIFLKLVEEINFMNIKIIAKIAGPFQDTATEKYVKKKIKQLPNVFYVGPKYGIEKENYFNSIDVLIFPTMYEHEAEPLTIYEAMMRGVPVISYGRGCIAEILKNKSGRVIQKEKLFIGQALKQLKIWISDPNLFENESQASRITFFDNYLRNSEKFFQFKKLLLT